jgi:hypothetical protein
MSACPQTGFHTLFIQEINKYSLRGHNHDTGCSVCQAGVTGSIIPPYAGDGAAAAAAAAAALPVPLPLLSASACPPGWRSACPGAAVGPAPEISCGTRTCSFEYSRCSAPANRKGLRPAAAAVPAGDVYIPSIRPRHELSKAASNRDVPPVKRDTSSERAAAADQQEG